MKLIAFLLPQFHRVAENDRWWGEGFTEWTNVKKAQSLYPHHEQPRLPLNNYYYDLTDPSARIWQAEMAKSHGIYGFCYYHYWFKGKQLLERPLQEILASKDPNFPFCLSWANESWTRKWDGLESEVLMPQQYGDEQDWSLHFNFLLSAFKDNRYIRVNGKPLFIIYRPSSIPRCEEMLLHWRKLALQNGLDWRDSILFVHWEDSRSVHRVVLTPAWSTSRIIPLLTEGSIIFGTEFWLMGGST